MIIFYSVRTLGLGLIINTPCAKSPIFEHSSTSLRINIDIGYIKATLLNH